MNILVYGDMGAEGSGNTTRHLKNLVASNQMDLVVHVGDISYADDYPGDTCLIFLIIIIIIIRLSFSLFVVWCRDEVEGKRARPR